ncbi:RidA family protein [Myroides odoratimimus]|uniref:RidA family protein n=1 Tax=Myroides odoratimimus TaxID=76832 RepID=UPI00257896C0|nr:RidA family protein [Myroides odoratimimus]MDM1098262.1 RidA family protein [Myroides odoratimimus]MDM1328117.1 RidA family protein [Myroides odoratimimus]MDM1444703.1 RidA family protein [Myroides odoratimimus]MDM1513741.1 RidA family protein [Myroides odoratimimus]MDO5858523.1 RidA family protein [Myroides odoratimimus]
MQDIQKVVRITPTTLSRPVGNYSHITIVPKNAMIYTFSGQIGTDGNGVIPIDFNQQVDNTFSNIASLLKSQELAEANIIKVNIWATKEIDWDYFDRVWKEFFKSGNPSMTVAYISALGLPEIDLEIEIWAAKV